MAKKYIDLVLDTIESDYSPVGVVKQLDSVIFNIKVTENSTIKDLSNQNIKLFAKKPNKTKVEQIEGINITNSINGELTIDLKNSALQAIGLVYFELELKDSEGTISTANFILRVDEKLGSNEAIESTNEFDTFEKIELEEQKRQEAERLREIAETERNEAIETIKLDVDENTKKISELEKVTKKEVKLKLTGGFEITVSRVNNIVTIDALNAATNGQLSGEGSLPVWALPPRNLGGALCASGANFNGVLNVTKSGKIYYFVATATNEVGVYFGQVVYFTDK
nr:MAG TPA: Baseplate component [Caudoviricetes sp.]